MANPRRAFRSMSLRWLDCRWLVVSPWFVQVRPPRSAGLLRRVALGAFCSLLGSCVRLSKQDAFPVASQPRALSSLQALVGQGGKVHPLGVATGGHPVTAYYVQHPKSRGVLLFFGGSGNEIEAPLKVLSKRTAALGLDLVVFSYYQEGEELPSVTAVRAESRAVYTAVRALPTPAARSVYLLGYSLGGWFALDVAAGESVRGLALVGAETTPAEVIHRTYAPWANVVAIRPDADAKQLDASLYAAQVRTPTLVVTSRQDEAVPAAVGQEIFGLLPVATPKHLVILEGVSHGRYFLAGEFWGQFAGFFGLSPSDARGGR